MPNFIQADSAVLALVHDGELSFCMGVVADDGLVLNVEFNGVPVLALAINGSPILANGCDDPMLRLTVFVREIDRIANVQGFARLLFLGHLGLLLSKITCFGFG